jgi:nucleotide-binding universal stress UspA family protein
MNQHILVPLDGSAVAEVVLPHAERFARLTGGALTLLHVATDAERSQTHFWVATAPSELRQQWEQAALTDVHSYLASLADRLQISGLSVRTEVVAAEDAAGAIVAYAQHDPSMALVAMATHGRGGLGRWVVGSVAAQVVRAAPKPMLLVRSCEAPMPVPMTPYRTIVIPLDGSPLSEQALAEARELPGAAEAKLVLIGVISGRQESVGTAVESTDTAMPETQPFERYLWRVAQQLQSDGFVAQVRLETGTPADTVLRVSAEEHADLIVMATHGRSGVGRLVLGSVAEEIIRQADLPVVLVRPSAGSRNRLKTAHAVEINDE